MTKEFIIVRNGCGPWSYIGQSELTDTELEAHLTNNVPIKLDSAYMLYTITVPLGPGKVLQDPHIFPFDNSVDKVDGLLVIASSAYRPTESMSHELRRLIDDCEKDLMRARSGLSVPRH